MTEERAISGADVLRIARRGQRRWVVGCTAGFMGHQIGEALVPVAIGAMIDHAISTHDGEALTRWLAVLAVLFAAFSLSYRFGARAGVRASEQAAHDLRVRIAARALHPRGSADRHLPGVVLNVATSDAAAVGMSTLTLSALFAALAALGVAAVALCRISLTLGIGVLVAAPPLLWLLHRLGAPLERRSADAQDESGLAAGLATDLVAGLRVLKGIGAERAASSRYRAASRRSLDATLRAANAESMFGGLGVLLTGVFVTAVALVAGRMAAEGRITVGDLVAIVGLAQFLLGPLSRFGAFSASFARSRASAARVAAVLATPFAVEGGAEELPISAAPRVELRGVPLGQAEAVDLDVAGGQLVGVVTDDTGQAADLLALLGRTADPATGAVLLDGTDLRLIDPSTLRGAIVVADHDAVLFQGSIESNVGAAAPRAEAITAALAASAGDEVTEAVPGGLQAIVGEQGRSLSGGQRQRLVLARALATDAPVLVVHDPTTAVDAMTEAAIAAGVRRLRAGRTTIAVTTSPALLAVCDVVVVLHGDGEVSTGSHGMLVDTDPEYRELVLS